MIQSAAREGGGAYTGSNPAIVRGAGSRDHQGRGAVSPDHIHMLVSAPAHLAPWKMVQFIKGRSSRRLQEEFPELRKKYWGQHMWERGYFCATVGAVDEATIKAYIENQKWDEDDQGFKITAPTEPSAGS
jgi:Transposase IS200 like